MGQSVCYQKAKQETDECVEQEFMQPRAPGMKPRELVTLHIYDAVGDARVQFVNELLRPVGAGAFHAGVELYGAEWSFGCREDDVTGTGIFSCEPRGSAVHRYREPVKMSSTAMSHEEVLELVERLKCEWQGRNYDLVSRNCCHFCEVFCRALGVGSLPAWVTNLAGTSASLISGVQALQSSTLVQSVREAWNSIDVELECIRADGVNLAALGLADRCISLRLAPDRPEPVGPLHQPQVFDKIIKRETGTLTSAGLEDHMFALGWQPPCLFIRKPSIDIPVQVNGRTVKQLTYVLLRNAEIGLQFEDGGKPRLVFKVIRMSAGMQVSRLFSKYS